MYKHTVTYEDFNGNTRTEDLYFNLSRSELVMLDNSVPGGLGNRLQRMVKAADNVEIMDTVEWLLRNSYGIKSEDGRRFIKGNDIFDEFKQTEAFDTFFMDLVSSEDTMAKFIRSILPKMEDSEWNKIQEKSFALVDVKGEVETE